MQIISRNPIKRRSYCCVRSRRRQSNWPHSSHDCRRTIGRYRFLILVVVALFAGERAHAQKTDIIYLHNGDRVTGEIKELVHGQVRISTDPFGIIHLKWQEVERIETTKRLQIETARGKRYFGPMAPGETADMLALNVSGQTVEIALPDVTHMQPIKQNERFQGNFDAKVAVGFSYTSASDIMRWNINASTRYRTEKYIASAKYDSLITNNSSGSDSLNRDLGVNYNRLLRDRWFWFGGANYQQNDELGIDSRILVSTGMGRVVSASRSHEFLLAAGINGNFETSTGSSDPNGESSETDSSLEGVIQADWTYFKLSTPKSDVNVTLSLYPGLSDTDRQRGNLQVRYRQEFVKDLFWNLSYFDNFDTNPPSGAISKRDYGIVTGLEYVF